MTVHDRPQTAYPHANLWFPGQYHQGINKYFFEKISLATPDYHMSNFVVLPEPNEWYFMKNTTQMSKWSLTPPWYISITLRLLMRSYNNETNKLTTRNIFLFQTMNHSLSSCFVIATIWDYYSSLSHDLARFKSPFLPIAHIAQGTNCLK